MYWRKKISVLPVVLGFLGGICLQEAKAATEGCYIRVIGPDGKEYIDEVPDCTRRIKERDTTPPKPLPPPSPLPTGAKVIRPTHGGADGPGGVKDGYTINGELCRIPEASGPLTAALAQAVATGKVKVEVIRNYHIFGNNVHAARYVDVGIQQVNAALQAAGVKLEFIAVDSGPPGIKNESTITVFVDASNKGTSWAIDDYKSPVSINHAAYAGFHSTFDKRGTTITLFPGSLRGGDEITTPALQGAIAGALIVALGFKPTPESSATGEKSYLHSVVPGLDPSKLNEKKGISPCVAASINSAIK